jgi:hypothetical protein
MNPCGSLLQDAPQAQRGVPAAEVAAALLTCKPRAQPRSAPRSNPTADPPLHPSTPPRPLQDVVMLRYLLTAAGDISMSDIDLAAASGGMVLGFNLEPDEAVLAHAKRLGEWPGWGGCAGWRFGEA